MNQEIAEDEVLTSRGVMKKADLRYENPHGVADGGAWEAHEYYAADGELVHRSFIGYPRPIVLGGAQGSFN